MRTLKEALCESIRIDELNKVSRSSKSIKTKTFGELEPGDTIYYQGEAGPLRENIVVDAHDIKKGDKVTRKWSEAGLETPKYKTYCENELIFVKYTRKDDGSTGINMFPKTLIAAMPHPYNITFSTTPI